MSTYGCQSCGARSPWPMCGCPMHDEARAHRELKEDLDAGRPTRPHDTETRLKESRKVWKA